MGLGFRVYRSLGEFDRNDVGDRDEISIPSVKDWPHGHGVLGEEVGASLKQRCLNLPKPTFFVGSYYNP